MLGRTNHVVVTVIKGVGPISVPPSAATGQDLVCVSARRSMRQPKANQLIVKEAFVPEDVPDVVSLFGKLCLQQDQYTAFLRTQLDSPLALSDSISPQTEIVVLKNDLLNLPKSRVAQLAERHRLIPTRNNITGQR